MRPADLVYYFRLGFLLPVLAQLVYGLCQCMGWAR